jgi:integrase
VIPSWGNRSVHEIGKRQVIDLVSEVAARGTPSAANKLLKVAKTFFAWCVANAILELSPAKRVLAPAEEKARDRVLEDNELAQIITAARQINGPYGGIVELLALTGQRREVAQLTWDELDLARQTWTLPGSRTKNGKPHMSREAVALLLRTPQLGKVHLFLYGRNSAPPNASSTNSLAHRAGAFTTCGERACPAWRVLAFPRKSPTRFSTISPGRSQGLPPSISVMSFWQSAKMPWSAGALMWPACSKIQSVS